MKFFKLFLFPGLICCLSAMPAFSQCGAGETELTLTIETDDWGYEGYWQITPFGNDCGTGTIAEGGNESQVGCNGAGETDASSSDYGDNTTIVEEDICLTIGETYTLHYTDDYMDGGFDFTLNFFGYNMYYFDGEGGNNEFVFVAVEPQAYDVQALQVLSYNYMNLEGDHIRGKFFNNGTETINEVEFYYSISGGNPVSGTVSSLSIEAFSEFEIEHPVIWSEATTGDYEITIWITSINGNEDMNTANDEASKTVTMGPGIPNILDTFIGAGVSTEEIAGAAQGVDHPRDLDFHPTLTRKELWVILKNTENTGGETVKITNAGEANQDELVQMDGNAWHFMSLPTGIAFSGNENFATSPGVYDANHDGGQPFTGPSLWSSDPEIYAQPSGGNGSHIDMLHESPYAMGIAWEKDNKFWLTCGDHDEIMSFDFREDHGPGNDDHSDGIIYKYPIDDYAEDASHEVPDHLVLDHETGWLYVCNSQQNRVIRINTNTGTPGDDEAPHEPVDTYKYMDNFDWEIYISEGLNEPTGIDIIDDRLIVSSYNTGDILLYDISGDTPVLLETIVTGEAGIMGVKIGPDGWIWYVNSITNQVMRITAEGVGVEEEAIATTMTLAPNPANESVTIALNGKESVHNAEIRLIDISGKVVKTEKITNGRLLRMSLTDVAKGVYTVVMINGTGVAATEMMIKE